MKRLILGLCVTTALTGCTRMNESPAPEQEKQAAAAQPAGVSHEEETRAWQKRRVERLTSPDNWLTLVGLYWLNEGENRIGSGKDSNNILLPAKTPATVGTMTLAAGNVTFTPAVPVTVAGETPVDAPAGKPIELRNDTHPDGPTVVQLGTITFQVVKRGDRYGVRMKDPESDTRKNFAGLDYFPIDPKWRVEARFEPYDPPKKIPITNVLGMTADEISPGALVFEVEGKEYRLDPILEAGSTDLFIIFKDATSRDATYPAGRYLYASPAGPDGKVIVDFNKAYNPPCAFTEFATCPLPPLQNRLPFRIEAGEKKYAGAH